jgi:hypothetical protein
LRSRAAPAHRDEHGDYREGLARLALAKQVLGAALQLAISEASEDLLLGDTGWVEKDEQIKLSEMTR